MVPATSRFQYSWPYYSLKGLGCWYFRDLDSIEETGRLAIDYLQNMSARFVATVGLVKLRGQVVS